VPALFDGWLGARFGIGACESGVGLAPGKRKITGGFYMLAFVLQTHYSSINRDSGFDL
jgi:hypothetical protein